MLPADNPCETSAPELSVDTLDGLVALIASDATTSPAEYLEETVVPHGGE